MVGVIIGLITSIIVIVLFFSLGYIVQGFKQLIGKTTKYLLELLSFLGIKIVYNERQITMSNDFYEEYRGIKTVKMSNKNLKNKSSISWICLAIFIISVTLTICNFNVISGNAISNWLYSIQPIKISKTEAEMNTFFTAIMFSCISFSLTQLINRWKETKQYRVEKKEQKIKQKAIDLMTSEELLNSAKIKDEKEYNEAKGE